MSDTSTSTKDLLLSIGKLIAVIMVTRYALLIINHYTNFITNETFATILNYVGLYAPLSLMSVIGLAAVWEKSEILRIVVAVVCAAVVIITFFPDVAQDITNWLNVGPINSI